MLDTNLDPVHTELNSLLQLMDQRHTIDDKIYEKRQAIQRKLKLGVGESKQYLVGKYLVKVKHTTDGPYAFELSNVT